MDLTESRCKYVKLNVVEFCVVQFPSCCLWLWSDGPLGLVPQGARALVQGPSWWAHLNSSPRPIQKGTTFLEVLSWWSAPGLVIWLFGQLEECSDSKPSNVSECQAPGCLLPAAKQSETRMSGCSIALGRTAAGVVLPTLSAKNYKNFCSIELTKVVLCILRNDACIWSGPFPGQTVTNPLCPKAE